jgi:hypothetical protein
VAGDGSRPPEPFEEERGRDAFEFEPILSRYLRVYESGFTRAPLKPLATDEILACEVRSAKREVSVGTNALCRGNEFIIPYRLHDK